MSFWIPSLMRDHYLAILVSINYWKRKQGLAPDEWYWADLELIKRRPRGMWCYRDWPWK